MCSLKLRGDTIQSLLRTRSLGREILLVDECNSTNDVASQFAATGAKHGFTVVAERQTHGRGRHRRVWVSPRGGIWMTTILRPAQHFEPLDGLPLLGALAIALSLSSDYGIKALVRWPNDVMCRDRKLAGTLVEAKFSGNTPTHALLGLGLNVNFHANEIINEAENATTVLDILGHAVDKAELVCSILLEIERLCDKLDSGRTVQILQQLKQHEESCGSRIVINLDDRRVDGIFEDYETLTKVRILDSQDNVVPIHTSSVVTVEYRDV